MNDKGKCPPSNSEVMAEYLGKIQVSGKWKVCDPFKFRNSFPRMRQFSRRPCVLAPDPLGSPGTSGLSQQCGVCPGSETEQRL